MYAPIVLFVYNRPVHTKKLLESLEGNIQSKKSELFIFSDGPKKDASKEQIERVSDTRRVIRERRWCGRVHIFERKENMGLANSVIAGVTEIINKFGRVIVLEDDLLLSKYFLKYVNDALDRYEKEEKVMQISGYMFPVRINTDTDSIFLPFTNSWGWATWKRIWDLLGRYSGGSDVLKKSSLMRKRFDLDNSYPFYNMLVKQEAAKIDSWAIRFYLSVFLNEGLVLYPRRTLVWNGGFDKYAIHTRIGILQDKIDSKFKVNRFPEEVVVREIDKDNVFTFIKKQNNIFTKIFRIMFGRIK